MPQLQTSADVSLSRRFLSRLRNLPANSYTSLRPDPTNSALFTVMDDRLRHKGLLKGDEIRTGAFAHPRRGRVVVFQIGRKFIAADYEQTGWIGLCCGAITFLFRQYRSASREDWDARNRMKHP